MKIVLAKAAYAYDAPCMKTWKYLGEKKDANGTPWRMWERDGIVKRSTMNGSSSGFTRTLYWRRGQAFADGTPAWMPKLSMLEAA